jgi:phasin family protein
MAKSPEQQPAASAASPFDISKLMTEFDPGKLMTEFSSMLKQYKLPGFDVDGVMATQKKNFEALTKANQTALQGLQALAKRQTEIFQETMAEAQKALTTLTPVGSPQEVAAKQAELAKNALEKAFANMRELADIVAKSSKEAADVINSRIAASLEELRDLAMKLKK